MKILPEPTVLEWDKGNIDKNLIKHNVTIQEIEQVFTNEEKIIFKDEKHSKTEKRYALFGIIDKERKLSIVFTLRRDKIRIITARVMSKRERRSYEKNKINTKV